MKPSEISRLLAAFPIANMDFLGVNPDTSLSKLLQCCNNGNFTIIEEARGHWFYVGKETSNTLELFNPQGHTKNNIAQICNENMSNYSVTYNEDKVENVPAKLSGAFCVTFAIHRSLHPAKNYSVLLNELFSSNYTNNCQYVNSFITELSNGATRAD